jgi:hypothetical protein
LALPRIKASSEVSAVIGFVAFLVQTGVYGAQFIPPMAVNTAPNAFGFVAFLSAKAPACFSGRAAGEARFCGQFIIGCGCAPFGSWFADAFSFFHLDLADFS